MFSGNTSQVSADQLYVEDVFSTWLYTGNGSTQTITNGIDLAGKGGLVWFKQRSSTESHGLFDTARGVQNRIQSNNTNAEFTTVDGLSAFNSSGFSIGSGNGVNASSQTYASWTFRKAPKFFDVVTYTGNGSTQTIAHNLGIKPGFILVKPLGGGEWHGYHQSLGATQDIQINYSGPAFTFTCWDNTEPTATNFTVKTNINSTGATYVAYLFAHDATSDGIIQCGSFDVDGSGNATVSLGWEPQWVLMKNYEAGDAWGMYDNMRGMPVGNNNVASLFANSASAEGNSSDYIVSPTATGFTAKATGFGAPGANGFIYMAIRRGPMKTPTLGTSVYTPIASSAASGTVSTTGFPVDLQIATARNSTVSRLALDRLRGVSTNSTGSGRVVYTDLTNAESSVASVSLSWDNTGFQNPVYLGGVNSIYWNFRRAPGFFDEVCYTGTGVAATISHNLGVVPELMIVKGRSGATAWQAYSANLANTEYLVLNTTAAKATGATRWNSTTPTSATFTVGTAAEVNTSAATYVAYLFASCPGVSKVGSYTGNGSSQTINCGFAAGARFVLIKQTDSTGDWYVWDTARGIVAANDPHLSLNTTAAEVTTDDTIDTDSSGFVVNQVAATNVNVSSATYIYLAIA